MSHGGAIWLDAKLFTILDHQAASQALISITPQLQNFLILNFILPTFRLLTFRLSIFTELTFGFLVFLLSISQSLITSPLLKPSLAPLFSLHFPHVKTSSFHVVNFQIYNVKFIFNTGLNTKQIEWH